MEVIGKTLKEFEIIEKILDKRAIFSNEPSEQLFKCILGLNRTESKVLCYLIKNSEVRTSEIAEELKMDRSSVQRALQVLSTLKLIERSSMSMKKYTRIKALKDTKKQGYLYVYNTKDIEAIKTHLKELLDRWYNAMLKFTENLDNLCECCGITFER
jgi:predicted transcriptional regulator